MLNFLCLLTPLENTGVACTCRLASRDYEEGPAFGITGSLLIFLQNLINPLVIFDFAGGRGGGGGGGGGVGVDVVVLSTF